MRPARLLALLAALAGAAWFVLGARQTAALTAAQALIVPGGHSVGHRPLTPVQEIRARGLIDRGSLLYPGEQPRILRADLAVDESRPAQARAVLAPGLRAHPDDLELWVALAGASYDSPADFRRALDAVRRLVPPLPPAHPQRAGRR